MADPQTTSSGISGSAERIAAGWLSRFKRFDVVTSTNDVVAEWLRAGTPEVCVAVTDVQSAGRGRDGRSWAAHSRRSVSVLLWRCPAWSSAP